MTSENVSGPLTCKKQSNDIVIVMKLYFRMLANLILNGMLKGIPIPVHLIFILVSLIGVECSFV